MILQNIIIYWHICQFFKVIVFFFQTKGLTTNGSMDRMKKLLSPGTRKKVFSANRTFGVQLEDLLVREGNKYKVPFVVMKICETIAEKGKMCSTFDFI